MRFVGKYCQIFLWNDLLLFIIEIGNGRLFEPLKTIYSPYQGT